MFLSNGHVYVLCVLYLSTGGTLWGKTGKYVFSKAFKTSRSWSKFPISFGIFLKWLLGFLAGDPLRSRSTSRAAVGGRSRRAR